MLKSDLGKLPIYVQLEQTVNQNCIQDMKIFNQYKIRKKLKHGKQKSYEYMIWKANIYNMKMSIPKTIIHEIPDICTIFSYGKE